MKLAQLCLTLCDPMDYTVHGILQARILEWVAPSPGDLPNPGIKPRSPALQADSLPAELPEKPCISHRCCLPHMCACQVPSVRSDSVTLWTVAHTMVQKNL